MNSTAKKAGNTSTYILNGLLKIEKKKKNRNWTDFPQN